MTELIKTDTILTDIDLINRIYKLLCDAAKNGEDDTVEASADLLVRALDEESIHFKKVSTVIKKSFLEES